MFPGIHPAMHNGVCSLCGSVVPRNSFDCTQCGAAWYSWQGPILRGIRVFLSIPAVIFMIGGAALLVLGLINQAPLATIEYFAVWVIIGGAFRLMSRVLPNNHSGWYQT